MASKWRQQGARATRALVLYNHVATLKETARPTGRSCTDGGPDIIQICGAPSLEVCVEGLLRMKLFKNSEELRENSEEILACLAFSGN